MSREDRVHLLPSNSNSFERALVLASQFNNEIKPESIKQLWNINGVPARFLSFLAWGLHVDFWNDDLSDEQKRILISNSFIWHRYKGTYYAVEKALADFGIDAKIYRWWEIGTRPHTIAIEGFTPASPLDSPLYSPEMQKMIREIIDVVKPERTHLEYFVLIPSPPDDPELNDPDHICRYSYCCYSHGWWPRPIEHGHLTDGTEHELQSFGAREHFGRMIYSLGPAYSQHRYGEALFARWLAFGAREHAARIEREEESNRARIWRIAFAHGVYSDGEPLGSLNCAYSPRYRHVSSMGNYGSARYSDAIERPEYRPIYRYYDRHTPSAADCKLTPAISDGRWARSYEHTVLVEAEGHEAVAGRERIHPLRTLRAAGKRVWSGRWSGKWADAVNEAVCRVPQASIREDV